ncbi:hypothetical protein KC323_g8 [Hortaea werneckii]|nr:hypothetical protein KC323_g8 [Hortaea werneckii]
MGGESNWVMVPQMSAKYPQHASAMASTRSSRSCPSCTMDVSLANHTSSCLSGTHLASLVRPSRRPRARPTSIVRPRKAKLLVRVGALIGSRSSSRCPTNGSTSLKSSCIGTATARLWSGPKTASHCKA